VGQKIINTSSKNANPKYALKKSTDKVKNFPKGYRKRHSEDLINALQPIFNNKILVKDIVSAIMKNDVMSGMSIACIKKLAKENIDTFKDSL
jgi:hypothetical protein